MTVSLYSVHSLHIIRLFELDRSQCTNFILLCRPLQHVGLGVVQEAEQLWAIACAAATPASDIALLAEAHALIKSLAEPPPALAEVSQHSAAAPPAVVSASTAATGDSEPQHSPQVCSC